MLGFNETTEPDRTEVDIEEAVVNLLETDVKACEESADRDALGVPADATVGADKTSFEVAGVGEGLEGFGEGPGRGRVEVGGHGAVEGFVRSDVIELGLEVTEGSLLGSHVRSGRPGSTALEHEVHVLVLPILLGAGRLDEIGDDPELNEPD